MKMTAMFGGGGRAECVTYLQSRGYTERDDGSWRRAEMSGDETIALIENSGPSKWDERDRWWVKIYKVCPLRA